MLSVLFTNIIFSERTGTEVATLELAYALRARGHRVAIFSPTLGPTAQRARSLGIPVTNSIETIGFKPDIIHGHHNTALTVALIRFPQTPALFVCHDTMHIFDSAPPLLDRITTYVAIDGACRDRLIVDGVPESQIQMIPNGVDLSRFKRREIFAETPKKALLVTKKDSAYMDEIKSACEQKGIELEVVGSGVGKVVDDLHERYGKADVVFAYSRSAMEAIATGAQVILTDEYGYGGFVTSSMIAAGFDGPIMSRNMLEPQVTCEAIIKALDQYDAQDLKKCSLDIQEKLGMNAVLSAWEKLYESVISTWDSIRDQESRDDAKLAAYISPFLLKLNEKYQDEKATTNLYQFDASDSKLKTRVGHLVGTTMQTTGRAGFVLYGLYMPLKAGLYQIKIYGQIKKNDDSVQSYADAVCSRGLIVLGKQKVGQISEPTLIADFKIVVAEDITDFEVRVWASAEAVFDIKKLHVVRLSNSDQNLFGVAV